MSESDSSGDRSERVNVFISEETKRQLDAEAERQGTHRSTLMAKYSRRGLRQDREDELAAETRAERRLGDVIDAGLDDMRDLAQQVEDHNARAGIHAIATFELIKRWHAEHLVRDALTTGAKRLRADEIDVDEITRDAGADLPEDDTRAQTPVDQDDDTEKRSPFDEDQRPGRSPPSPDEMG